MLPNKFSLKWGWMAMIGFAVVSCGGLSAFFSMLVLNEISPYKFRPVVRNHVELIQILKFAITNLILFLATFAIWKRITFTRKDFINVVEEIGVKFTRKRFYYTWLDFIDTSRFADGFLDDIYVVARLDFPFFGFYYYDAPRDKGYRAFDFIKEKSQVLMCSLVNGLPDISVAIRITDEIRYLPSTGTAEIDRILFDAFKDVKYFHARLLAANNCLKMTIIGGSWEGRRFGDKILKGFELFKKLDNELKSKYPKGDWKNWQVKWNERKEEFLLEPQGGSK